MHSAPGADEHRVRHWLRSRGVGPDAPPPEPPVPGPVPGREPDWLDRLYEDDDRQPEPEPGPDTTGQEHAPRWWSVAKDQPAPPPAEQPGVQVVINQAAPQTSRRDAERLHRRRLWLAYHGAAAGAGWAAGLGPAVAGLLDSSGPAAPAVGLGFVLVTWIPASYLPGLPFIPKPLRPLTVWLSRVPASTAVLALALHAPGAIT